MASCRIPSFQSPFLHSPRKQKANESLLRSKSKKCPGPRGWFFFPPSSSTCDSISLEKKKENPREQGWSKKMLLKKENRRPIKWYYQPCNQSGVWFDCVHTCFPLPWVCCTSDWRHEMSLRAVDNLPFINTVDDKLKCFADRSSTNTAPTVDPACRETNPFILFVTWMDWIYISSFFRLGSMLLFDSLAWAGGRETLFGSWLRAEKLRHHCVMCRVTR